MATELPINPRPINPAPIPANPAIILFWIENPEKNTPRIIRDGTFLPIDELTMF